MGIGNVIRGSGCGSDRQRGGNNKIIDDNGGFEK